MPDITVVAVEGWTSSRSKFYRLKKSIIWRRLLSIANLSCITFMISDREFSPEFFDCCIL